MTALNLTALKSPTFTVGSVLSARMQRLLAVLTGAIAVSALGGATGLISGSLPLPAEMSASLPWQSPVFSGIALGVIVALPMTWATWLLAARRGGADVALAAAGVLLLGWIIVEILVIRRFSWLQPTFGLLGAVTGFLGYRSWQLRWGAQEAELKAPMAGDNEVPGSQFRATRAITIEAPPERVWPWLVQVGRSRAGFYSYDQLDNAGRPSAQEILPQYQNPHAGDLAAPMTPIATELTAFRVHRVETNRVLLWSKPDSTWSWRLTPLPDGGTRLVTRLRVRYEWAQPLWALSSLILIELADFPMMRKMLLGIRRRAEGRLNQR